MKRLLFVCTGNICRSPMAEYLLREMVEREGSTSLQIASAGVGAVEGIPATDKVVELLYQEGIDCQKHRSRPVTKDMLAAADLILVMTSGHQEKVLNIHPQGNVYRLKEYGLQEQLAEKKRRLMELKASMAEEGPTEDREEESLDLEQDLFQLDIHDPYGKDLGIYRECLAEIRDSLQRIMGKIRPGSQ